MRLYITGCVGSGKSTLARRLSTSTGIKCTHLDEVMYEPAPDDISGNRKRDPNERDKLFAHIISEESWIIEDAGRECFRDGLVAADSIIVLDLPLATLYFRVILRWIKQLIGIEACIYRPTLTMLRSMIRWIGEYDCSQFDHYESKILKLKNQSAIEDYIKETSSGE